MGPFLLVSGASGSGKTTLLERVLPFLVDRHGLRVAVLKNAPHGADLDRPGSDTARLAGAGAAAVAVAAGTREALFAPRPDEDPRSTARRLLPDDCDLYLIEGGKSLPGPKLEVVRSALSRTPVCDPASVLVYVTDVDDLTDDPTLPLDEPDQVAEFIAAWAGAAPLPVVLRVGDREPACNRFVEATLLRLAAALTADLRRVEPGAPLRVTVFPAGSEPLAELSSGDRRVGLKPFVAAMLAGALRGFGATLDGGPAPHEAFTLDLAPWALPQTAGRQARKESVPSRPSGRTSTARS